MSDKFGRHQSTRWVRASVPSYGDEWNDDDGYDYGSMSDDSNVNEADEEPIRSPELNNVPPERFVLPSDKQSQHHHKEDQHEHQHGHQHEHKHEHEHEQPGQGQGKDQEQEQESPTKSHDSKLVLSIDNLQDQGSDNDSNLDPDDKVNLHDDKGEVKPQTLVTNLEDNSKGVLEPPTPTYNVETPSSEQSFQSDDSIQNEPTTIRVANPPSHVQSHNKAGLYGYNDIIEEYPDDKEDTPKPEHANNQDNNSDTESESIKSKGIQQDGHENLVLSIDNKRYDTSDDSDNDDDPIPYYEKQTHPDRNSNAIDDSSSDNDDDADDADADYRNHSHNKSDALDSLINDLQSASFKEEGLPKMDSIHNISLPDFENNYDYYDYDDTEDKPVTPIAPLSTADEKSYHERYVNELSGHKPSIRKPPTPLNFSGKELHSNSPNSTSRNSSIRKPLPESVVSPSYSNFGDAVDAYMSDRGSDKGSDHTQEIKENNDDNDSDTTSANGSEKMDQPTNDKNNNDIYENLNLGDENEPEEYKPPRFNGDNSLNINSNESNIPELHPVASTGSLSTGKHSFDQRTDFSEPHAPAFDREITRRDSTMSTNTISMGGWKPNTNNFRDQFINDNDNDSNFNFSLDNESTNGYQRFTKPRNISNSDNMSFVSSVSIPETVDVPLPSIHEDPADNDLDKDDTFSSADQSKSGSESHSQSQSKNDSKTQGLGISESNTTDDSILNQHGYDKGFFQEELSSKESISKDSNRQQRYTSLLPPISDDGKSVSMTRGDSTLNESSSIVPSVSISNTPTLENSDNNNSDHKRVNSNVSTFTQGTGITQGTRKTFPPNAYPVSNWKTIMKPSQPTDRINLLRDALEKEIAYDTGLQTWLSETLTKSNNSSNIHIGRIASEAYQNATHNDLRRHTSIRSRVSSVKDKVETSGLHASNLGKKFFSRGKKLMRSNS